ncbi:MAG TPA: peptide deformylase [Candidatus Hypogeohydataceae bacterium YC40]
MNILYYPEPVLHKKALPIKDINSRAEELLEKGEIMLRLMYEAAGIGLAANQVGLLERLVVKDETGEHKGERVFINPEIISADGEILEEEGCLSLPGIYGKVTRAKKVVVVAYNLKGERLEMEAEDLLARVWQHEIDHLNGTLIIDRMSPASRLAASRRLKELEQVYKEGSSRVRTL